MRRRRRKPLNTSVNMTPMIDVVFQMIIFFVVTIEMEQRLINENIRLAMSPDGPAIEKKDPRTVVVEVDADGRITIARARISAQMFTKIMRKAVSENGQNTPVLIRGDARTRHSDIRRVVDACTQAGLWKVSFAATKEKARKGT